MFSKIFPKIVSCGRVDLRSILTRRCYYRPSRHLPMWRPNRSLVEDFFCPRRNLLGPFESVGSMIKNMDRMMEDVWRTSEHPWAARNVGGKDAEVIYNSKKFEVKVDVTQYAPEEINVKVIGDKLEISAKHSEKRDEHGYVSREFTRQFLIPEDVETESMESLLGDDGMLTITAKVKESENANERIIQIQRDTSPKEASESK